MAISNTTQIVSVTSSDYLNFPINNGLSINGYWYIYKPASANNDVLAANVIPYQWGNALPLVNSQTEITIEGTIPLIEDTWDSGNLVYHGGVVEWIGSGINDITNTSEDNAFFFGHLGAYAASDDAFYWDRMYLESGTSEWQYYQYHKHLPTFYAEFEQGRALTSGGGFLVPEDKEFGYIINNRVKESGTTYISVMSRIHTPSIGGAHNSHNDVTLPSLVPADDYINCGIIRGTSNRYHAFYMKDNGSDWTLLSRTYTAASTSFTAEVELGTYDFADATFDKTVSTGDIRGYAVRASCGALRESKIFMPVVLNNATSGYDLEIWCYSSDNAISTGTLERFVMETGISTWPDCQLLTVSSVIYALYTDSTNGGLRLQSYDGTSWTDEGRPVTNGSSNPLRVHGFKYNSTEVKYYALVSGTSDTSGTYANAGIYSFELGSNFSGYEHLDYDAANNALVVRPALDSGYLEYDVSTSVLTRYTGTEPEGIAENKRIFEYSNEAAGFFNKQELDLGGEEYFFDGITLEDGRRIIVGRIEELSYGSGAGDIFVGLQDADDPTQGDFFAWGGLGDDYLTGVTQAADGNIWITGYGKSELVEKKDFKIHGWARNINDGANKLRWQDVVTDSTGNIYLCGNHETDEYIITAKYDYNYNLLWQKKFDAGSNADVAHSMACDSNDNIYIVGSTTNFGEGNTDALLFSTNSDGELLFNKTFGTSSAEVAKGVAVITKANVEYVAISINSGTETYFVVTDTSGTALEKNRVANLNVNKLRADAGNPNQGRFLFAGNDGAGDSKFGACEYDHGTRMVQWFDQYNTAATSGDAVDFQNISLPDQNGNGGDYVVVGSQDGNAFIVSMQVDEDSANVTFNVGKTWGRQLEGVTPTGMAIYETTKYYEAGAEKYINLAGYQSKSVNGGMNNDVGFVASYESDGALDWQNYFGFMMPDRFTAITNDVTGENFIAAGWTMSHTVSSAGGAAGAVNALLFRGWNEGFGTGVYHLDTNPGAGYIYQATTQAETADSSLLAGGTPSADISIALLENTSNTAAISNTSFTNDIYDGSFGKDGVFQLYLVRMQLDKIQDYLNSQDYLDNKAQGKLVNFTDQVFDFWELGTVGDASADDGNTFGYDIIQHSNGELVIAAVTSGDITKENTGTSGVYDYMIVRFDPATEQFRYFQAGSALDEEIYALSELDNTKVAFVGRSTGTLGSHTNLGGYDIFLGLYDMDLNSSEYYQTGSGFDDRGLNVHDVSEHYANTLAVVYSTYGAVGNATVNAGSEDMGVILFDYVNDTWGNAYQTGSSTSEVFTQNGHHSELLDDGRIAIVGSSAGFFADDNITSGLLDVVLGLININTGEWRRFQTGTGANDFGTAVFKSGDVLNIIGHTEASFADDRHGLYMQFDALNTINGKDDSL